MVSEGIPTQVEKKPGSPDSSSSVSLSMAFSLCPLFFKQKASEKDQIGTSSPLTTIEKRLYLKV